MGSIGPVQLLIIAVIILVLFGRGKISEMMGDFGKGISSFKKGMSEPDDAGAENRPAPSRIEGPAHEAKPAGEPAEKPVDKSAG